MSGDICKDPGQGANAEGEHLRAGVDRMALKMADGSLFIGHDQTVSQAGERLAS